MIEIERKFRLATQQRAKIELLLLTGYGQAKTLHQVDEIFTANTSPYKDFSGGPSIIRLRKTGNKTQLTYKRTINKSGDSIEHELAIGSENTMRQILLELGCIPCVTVEKHRLQVHKDGITLVLDTVKYLGDFMEIEIVAKDQTDLKVAEQRIMQTAQYLGLTENDIEPLKYDQLMLKT